jgi:hypothetical protein
MPTEHIFPPVPSVSVPVAAYAAGVCPRTFRDWIANGAIRLLAPRSAPGRWLRVSPADIVRLAVAGRLLAFGFTLAEANEIIRDHLDTRIEGAASLADGGASWHLLENLLRGHALTVSREPDGIAVSFATIYGARTARHTGATLTVEVGWICTAARKAVASKLSTGI